ncbi:carbohydrate ABC transporter permease [Halopelagius longus]|uniref:Carbohydrate ABC transporter membrane protein 2, CUT1 family n=2 Tax=Halopelagius longus TaxID=1236180 RepID=A0A1H1G508_9EURY|nr:carbohydrate ABC transporter permease [Halopelagius longus]RDI69843.1 carbohydrate ABC transporter permease [Halopelagius longus]SDR08233.1 carbohydrate ABC transporter membrane protein 2, CUT1 family [Halopelagius longus]
MATSDNSKSRFSERLDVDLIAKYAVLIATTLLIAFPLLWMVSTALKTSQALSAFPPEIIPSDPTLQPTITALTSGPWVQWFVNTFVVVTGTVILELAVATPAAYALARRDFLGERLIYVSITAFLMIPPQILILPVFIQFAQLHLTGTFVGLMVAYTLLFSAFVTFLLSGFFQTLPSDVEDAARIAGIPEWKIFLKIVLPLAKPAIGIAAIFVFVFAWNEFFWALVFLDDRVLYTISIGLTTFEGTQGQFAMNRLMAMSILTSLPVLILFALTQERFIQGITTGYDF